MLLFDTFSNPAADKYAWLGADKKEVIWLNDFCWSRELIEWKSFLLLLEGDQLNLPAPKNQYATDVCIDHDVPNFATSKDTIKILWSIQRRRWLHNLSGVEETVMKWFTDYVTEEDQNSGQIGITVFRLFFRPIMIKIFIYMKLIWL